MQKVRDFSLRVTNFDPRYARAEQHLRESELCRRVRHSVDDFRGGLDWDDDSQDMDDLTQSLPERTYREQLLSLRVEAEGIATT